MNDILKGNDLTHALLDGIDIPIGGGLSVRSIPMDEMAKFGFDTFSETISLLCIDEYKLRQELHDEDITTFIYVARLVYRYQKYKEPIEGLNILNVLSIILGSKVTFNVNYGFVVDDKYVLGSANYDDFKKILRARFCLDIGTSNDEDDENPADARAKALLRRRRETREKLKRCKQSSNEENNDNCIGFTDYVSIFAEFQKISLHDVYVKYDIYQFYDQFKRMKIDREYSDGLKAVLAGTKVDLKHWFSKIETENE